MAGRALRALRNPSVSRFEFVLVSQFLNLSVLHALDLLVPPPCLVLIVRRPCPVFFLVLQFLRFSTSWISSFPNLSVPQFSVSPFLSFSVAQHLSRSVCQPLGLSGSRTSILPVSQSFQAWQFRAFSVAFLVSQFRNVYVAQSVSLLWP